MINQFIKSDYCDSCGGDGFRIEKTCSGPFGEDLTEYEQCERCEELHKQEIKADRLHDEMKGN